MPKEDIKKNYEPVEEPPGAELKLNVLIAKHIMGLVPCSYPVGRCKGAKTDPPTCWGHGAGGSELEGYSSNVSSAFKVVKEMLKQGYDFSMDLGPAGNVGVIFSKKDNVGSILGGGSFEYAICLAALKAKGIEGVEK